MTEANYTGYPSVDKPWLKYYSLEKEAMIYIEEETKWMEN